MKTIGIKLADGTFYPILEEGTPKKRMLDLTTAKDNQTKVQIDLYRSENGTMDDAEYVDTLEVTKLNPHPNGEPELHLSVGLDEENKLTAEVVDPETGKKSETEVTLVSRTLAERNEESDFGVSGAVASDSLEDMPDFSDQIVDSDSKDADETVFSPEDMPDINSNALEDMPFSFDQTDSADADEPNSDENKDELPDFSNIDDDFPVEDTTLESVKFQNDDYANIASDDDDDDFIGTTSPDLAEDSVQTDTTAIAETESNDSSADSFSLPDFDSDDTTFASDFTAENDSHTSEPESFELPDFDAPVTSSESNTSLASGISFDDFDDPAFNSTEFDSTLDSLNSESEDHVFDDTASGAAVSSAMDFSDLYDKETLAGEHASLYEEEEEQKKTRIPVIICIVCAIICIIATILLLFIIPSKYNLIKSRNTNGVSILDRFTRSKTEKVIEETDTEKDTEFIDVLVEEPKEEAAPEAVEDKIVIAPEPEKVVPVPPPAPVEEKKPEVKKSADVQYHIRWGDTLWDISESYYKTPWKYPKIADYNKIKNPDLIISGTDILLPSE